MVNIGRPLAPILGTDPPTKEGRENCKADVLQLVAGARASATALLLPDNLSIEDWVTIGDAVHRHQSSVQWWLGDWWHYGAHKYGDRIKAAAKGIFNYEFGTLANYGYVAGAVKPSLRNEHLSMWHHYQVAPLQPREQKKWLDRAARFKWTAMQLRSNIAGREEEPTDEQLARQRAERLEQWAKQALGASNCCPGKSDVVHLEAHRIEELKTLAAKVVTDWTCVVEQLDRLVARSAPPRRRR